MTAKLEPVGKVSAQYREEFGSYVVISDEVENDFGGIELGYLSFEEYFGAWFFTSNKELIPINPVEMEAIAGWLKALNKEAE